MPDSASAPRGSSEPDPSPRKVSPRRIGERLRRVAPIRSAVRWAREARERARLPEAARLEAARDRRDGLLPDPGRTWTVEAAAKWLCRAQDRSATADGGVAHHYSLRTGWAASYPETTGYIIPTMFRLSDELGEPEYETRAVRMLDWLLSIQLPQGAWQGGVIGAEPRVPVTFNTGQIVLGLAAGVARIGERYRQALRAAGDWLVETQAPAGCWDAHVSPFGPPGAKAFDTHIAWGLFEADRVEPGRGYGEAGLRNARWAVEHQRENGWLERCCLSDHSHPLTHTLGYALQGLLEAYRYANDDALLEASVRAGRGILGALDAEGGLPGRLDEGWEASAGWVCLTGSSQAALCWMFLYEATGDSSFLDGAVAANRFVRRTLAPDAPPDRLGAVKGSFPVDGGYCTYEYPNWAAKFTIDAQMAEMGLRATSSLATGST